MGTFLLLVVIFLFIWGLVAARDAALHWHKPHPDRSIHHRWTQAATALILAVLITIAGTAAHNILSNPKQTIGNPDPLPTVPQQSLKPTDLQQVEETLGPFTTLPVSNSATPDTKYPAVLLIRQDGSIAASVQWSVPFQSLNWVKQDAVQIVSLTVKDGYATFSTGPGRAYTVRCSQPFVLEAVPQFVWVIDSGGKQWSISSNNAAALRQHS